MTNVTKIIKLTNYELHIEAEMDAPDCAPEIHTISIVENNQPKDISEVFQDMSEEQITELYKIDWAMAYSEHMIEHAEYMGDFGRTFKKGA